MYKLCCPHLTIRYGRKNSKEGKKMDYIDVIGLTAGALGGFSLFPQVLKVLRTKSTKDISREMFLLLATSIFLWLIYGILLNNFPIILANFFGFIQAFIILFFKIENQLRVQKLTPGPPRIERVTIFMSDNTETQHYPPKTGRLKLDLPIIADRTDKNRANRK